MVERSSLHPLRILHVIPAYKPAFCYGGTTFSVSRLAEKQAELGAEVWAFTTTANGAEDLQVPVGRPVEIEGVRVVYFRRWTGDHGHFCPSLWWALWRQGEYFEVVHVHSWWNWVVLGAMLVCRWRRFRTLFSPHGMLGAYTLRSRWRRCFQHTIGRWLLSHARWHATSRFEYEELRTIALDAPLFCLPNVAPLPDGEICPTDKREGSPARLLFLSRIDPKKGLDFLLEVLAGLDTHLDWEMTIAGDADAEYGRQIRALAFEKGLDRHLHWVGWTEGEAKWGLLAQSDLLVLPSRNENFAVVVLEALSVGTAVVLSDQVGLADYVQEHDLGWCAPLHVMAWRRVIKEALEDKAKLQRVRERAPAILREDFDGAAIVRQYLSAYQSPIVQVIFRKPIPGGHYSIERSFGAMWPHWVRREGMLVQKVVACAYSCGLWSRLRIVAQMRRLRADVFHVSGDIHFAALFLPGSRTVLTIHDCGFVRHANPLKRFLLKWLWLRWPVSHCRQIVAVSEATKADIVRHTGCDPAKITVIPSAVPQHFQSKPKPFATQCPRILHIGSAPNKNLLRHIEALEGIPCVLHIVGNIGPEERRMLKRCAIAFECTPHIDDTDMVRAYEECDLLLFASTFEGFGMPILEAQIIGRPVVTSCISSMPEVAGPEGACLVNPFCVVSIRQGILRVIHDAAYRERLIQKGFENTRKYRAEEAAAAYAALYQEFAKGTFSKASAGPLF